MDRNRSDPISALSPDVPSTPAPETMVCEGGRDATACDRCRGGNDSAAPERGSRRDHAPCPVG
jgi:hypothetical protein